MSLKKADVTKFDPAAAGSEDANIFGLDFSHAESNIVLVPLPWEATTSYGRGAAKGPQAILQASPQLDLFDAELGRFGLPRPWEFGIHMEKESAKIKRLNRDASKLALSVIRAGGKIENRPVLKKALAQVNKMSREVNDFVYDTSKRLLESNKIVGIVGGDHSSPYGAMRACAEKFSKLGILHIDAHADLREAYMGFEHSHASIMNNVVQSLPILKLVQVGIRDFCDSEFELSRTHSKIKTFYDFELKDRLSRGESWEALCLKIVDELPEHVYVSFDIDGLEPALCPHTGTPVAGGLRFHEATFLLKCLHERGKKIVAFDLNEVAPGPKGDEWDGNVGARVLYKLCGLALLTNGARN